MSLIALLTASSLALLKPNLTVLMIFWACRPLLAKSADLRDSAFSGQILPDVQVFLNFVSLTSPYKLTQTVLVVYGYIQHLVSSHIRRSFCFSVRGSGRLPATYFVALIF